MADYDIVIRGAGVFPWLRTGALTALIYPLAGNRRNAGKSRAIPPPYQATRP